MLWRGGWAFYLSLSPPVSERQGGGSGWVGERSRAPLNSDARQEGVPLQNLPCKRCSARTDQLTLLVQLYGPEGKHWWENVFTVCTSCLQVGRYALNSVQETLYMDVLPPPTQPNKLEGGVVAILLMYGPLKAGAIQRRLREREGVRLNRHETEHLLDLMGQKGLVAAEKADWTEKVVAMLLESNKRQACSKCGKGGVTSLYAQMRNVPRGETKIRVGSFCPSCRHYTIDDARALLKRFVKGLE